MPTNTRKNIEIKVWQKDGKSSEKNCVPAKFRNILIFKILDHFLNNRPELNILR